MITNKILVVDDEQTVCDSIKKILSRKGYSVDESSNVEDAVNKIKDNSYDLVITDLMMPKTNGMELLQIVKQHYPELEVVIITGYASIDTAVKATKLGASDYLPKPFTPEELVTITQKAIEKRKENADKKKTVKQSEEKKSDVIDVDMPFSEAEVEQATSKDYVRSLTHTDIPLAKKSAKTRFCNTGQRECRRLVLEGVECVGECPLEKKAKAKTGKTVQRTYSASEELIDVDLPFKLSDVEKATSSEYIDMLDRSDMPRAALYGKNTEAKHNVLVVDDEPIVCHSLRRILTNQSCKVEEAFDVDVAMNKMKLNKYDIIFLDLRMPKKDGMEVLKTIKELYPDTPVIMITGYSSIETAVEATKLGAFQFIPKPFTPEELKVATQEVLAA